MPTFNQLVKQGREKSTYKSKAPVLQHGFNTLTDRATRHQLAPEERRLHEGHHDHPEEA